jgi:hypothetical protein
MKLCIDNLRGKIMKKVTMLNLLCVLFCAAFLQLPLEAKAQGAQRITGTAIGIGGTLGGRSRQFTLIVNNYTPVNQVRELNEALTRGQDEMLKVMSDMKAGRIQIGSGVGVDANVVIAEPWGDGGRKLTVFYERNVDFYELRYGARSQDYKFGYAELFLEASGNGQGTLIAAARIRLKGGNTWEVEDFGTFPARLMGLRSRGRVEPR